MARASTAVASLVTDPLSCRGVELARYKAEYGDCGKRLAALGGGLHGAYGRLGDIASQTSRFDGIVRGPLHDLAA
jgi:hypothetical protein